MTDESILIGLVKLQVRKLKLGGFSLRKISNEAIMISNLPLLFADGYPTCLEKFTLRQLEKFVPFMIQCSLGQNYLDRFTPIPKWWPADLPFSIFVEKPVGMDDTRWFAMLKSMVCRCYTYHGCEFMLRFCTELSEFPSTTYMFVEALDGTTSLYNKETRRLMVTFRNENREYDKEVESSPRRSLLPKNCSQNTSCIMVPPPIFDIYLCENCDGEFDSLSEVQEHEKTCGRHQISQETSPEEQPQQNSQDSFLCYFSLKPVNSEHMPREMSPMKKNTCKKRYPAGVTFTRCCGVPFSSPLGVAIQKKSRMATINPQVLLDRMERYCVTKTVGPSSRFRDIEDKLQEPIEWPNTWKPPPQKKAQDTWSHHYCFTIKERCERMARKSSAGLNKRSRRLLSKCRGVQVVLTRLREEEIVELTTRVPTPEHFIRDDETVIPLPMLLPNTMYSYNTSMNNKDHYPEPIALSPQATIPVIDLCSTDEEDEGGLDEVESLTSVALLTDENSQLILTEQNETGSKEVEPVFCDKNDGPNITIYPLVETCAPAYGHMATSSSCVDSAYTMQYSGDTSVRFPDSVPHGWHMKFCIKTPPSPSPAPAFSHEEEHVSYSSQLHYNSANIPLSKVSVSQRKERAQAKSFNKISTPEETFGCDVEQICTPLIQCNATDDPKLYSSHVSLCRTRTQAPKIPVPSTSLTCDSTDTAKCISKFSFPREKEEMQAKVFNTISPLISPSTTSGSEVEGVTYSVKSHHSKLSLNCKREQRHPKPCSTSLISEQLFHHNPTDAHLYLYEGKERIQTNLLRMVPNTSSPVSLHENVLLDGEALGTSASNHSKTHRRDRHMKKLFGTMPPSPSSALTLDTDENSVSYASLQCVPTDTRRAHKSGLSVPLRRDRSRSKILTTPPLPATAPNFTQEGDGTAYAPPHFDSKSQHSTPSLLHRRERTRKRRAAREPILMEDVDPDPKKPKLQVCSKTVPEMESATQDTSNNDIFGMSVKHEKATEYLQRCMAKHRSPPSVRRLHQDECRELRRRGLNEVMNRSGRVLRGQLVNEEVHPQVSHVALVGKTCSTHSFCQVKAPEKVGNLFRRGRIVTVSLKDNEVELLGGASPQRNLCNLENNNFCWNYSKHFHSFDMGCTKFKFGEYNNQGIKDALKRGVCNKGDERSLAAHSCPSLKVEQCPEQLHMGTFTSAFAAYGLKDIGCQSDGVLKCKIGRWGGVDYFSPVVRFRVDDLGQTVQCCGIGRSVSPNPVNKEFTSHNCRRKLSHMKQNDMLRMHSKLLNRSANVDMYFSMFIKNRLHIS